MGSTDETVRRRARVLAGFMSPQEATGFAQNFAIEASSFLASWKKCADSRSRLAPGYVPPQITDLPPASVAHTTQLLANPLFGLNYGPNAELKMVELGKLIAMQTWMDCDASDLVHGAVSADLDQLLQTCLPLDLSPAAQTRWQQTPNGLIVHTLNNSFGLKGLAANPSTNQIQIVLGTNANLMLVREHAGRHILANGYHRAWMLRFRGVELVPAVVVQVPDLDIQAGFLGPQQLLGPRPPLVDDFLNDDLSVATDVRSMMTTVKLTIDVFPSPRLL